MRSKILIGLLTLALAGCESSRYSTEFELDEKTFDSDAMQMVRDDSDLVLPPQTRGLNFHYLPPIDPEFVARLEIPKEAQTELLNQIATKKIDQTTFMDGGLPAKTAWWKLSQGQVLIDRQWLKDSHVFQRAVLVVEGDRLILYLYRSV